MLESGEQWVVLEGGDESGTEERAVRKACERMVLHNCGVAAGGFGGSCEADSVVDARVASAIWLLACGAAALLTDEGDRRGGEGLEQTDEGAKDSSKQRARGGGAAASPPQWRRCSVYLLYWYKSTLPDATGAVSSAPLCCGA